VYALGIAAGFLASSTTWSHAPRYRRAGDLRGARAWESPGAACSRARQARRRGAASRRCNAGRAADDQRMMAKLTAILLLIAVAAAARRAPDGRAPLSSA
jgi:hypothetical protein